MQNNLTYHYLDKEMEKMRKEKVGQITEKGRLPNDLDFYDLGFYNKESNNFKHKAKSAVFSSKIDSNIQLTRYQVEILSILEDNNLFLSAPTSFGKTFIILEYMKRNMDRLNNVIFIIPTIALMNELLKKINNYFGDYYSICINKDESRSDKNIFIFVPERSDQIYINTIKEVHIDLLVFDEIYKLQSISRKELLFDDRLILMNKVYLQLVGIAEKVVLLGPFINDVSFENTDLDIVRYFTNFSPVFNEVAFIEEGSWINYLMEKSQLVYFKTPESIYKNIPVILSEIEESDYHIEKYQNEINYLNENVSPDWYAVELLKRGIGIHHGKTPIYLRKFFENEYNTGGLSKLLCTSTLMEGINTPTLSLLVVDYPGSPFKLTNLIGRVGRLNVENPSSGKVYLSGEEMHEVFSKDDNWLKLNIMAEDNKVTVDDEVLYLEKEYEEGKQKNEFDSLIREVEKEYSLDIEEIRDYGLELKYLKRALKKEFVNNMNSATSVHECIDISTKVITAPSWSFRKDRFIDLNMDYSYLPYKHYIRKLLYGSSVKNLVMEFNNSFNTSKNHTNINVFIDSIYNLINYIKFKLSKISVYVEALLDDTDNKNVIDFYNILNAYNTMSKELKILDDLGITGGDARRIADSFGKENKVNASIMIKYLKSNKEDIFKEKISPFSMNNILNM